VSALNGRCTTCACPVEKPYRRHNAAGAIVEGCIDACHTGLTGESAAWHDRACAVAYRASVEEHRNRILRVGRLSAAVHRTEAGRFIVASFHGTYYASLSTKWAFHPTAYARTVEELAAHPEVRSYASHAGAARILRRDYG